MLAVFAILAAYTLQFFGCFFPPNAMKFIVLGNLGMARLFIWASFGYVTFKEFYLYACEDPRSPPSVEPEYIWIGFTAAFLENFIEVKWFKESQVQFTGGMQPHVIICWAIGLSIIASRYLYLKFYKNAGCIERVSNILKEKDD